MQSLPWVIIRELQTLLPLVECVSWIPPASVVQTGCVSNARGSLHFLSRLSVRDVSLRLSNLFRWTIDSLVCQSAGIVERRTQLPAYIHELAGTSEPPSPALRHAMCIF